MFEFDTIAAIATPIGNGGIAIIRVSGDDAINLVNRIFEHDLTKMKTHTIKLGYITEDNQPIDEVLVSVMKGPNSFTGEDVVEINCHGGVIITNKILDLCLKSGARLAEPGEFTKRAFLNGRIKLNEAEAISDLIHATNETIAKHAISGLKGKLTKEINNLRENIIEILADIEVNIDYPEYNDLPNITKDKIIKRLNSLQIKIENLLQNSKSSNIIENGIKTILIGKPNVGKSSILNTLLNEEKAIVTDIPGTTRDTVEGKIMLEGIHLNLIDTAGLRDTDNLVEELGVKKSKALLKESDLILYVLNNNEKITKEDLDILKEYQDKLIVIINKTDLEKNLDLNLLKGHSIVETSTINNTGFEVLKKQIIELFNIEKINQNDNIIYLNKRQHEALDKANNLIKELINNIKEDTPIDLLPIDLKEIWEILSTITGDVYDETLLDNLFSRFCLGK